MSDQANQQPERLQRWDDILRHPQGKDLTEIGTTERDGSDDPDMALSDDGGEVEHFEDVDLIRSDATATSPVEPSQNQPDALGLIHEQPTDPITFRPDCPRPRILLPSPIIYDNLPLPPAPSSLSSGSTVEFEISEQGEEDQNVKLLEVYEEFTSGDYWLYQHPIYCWYRCRKPR